MSQYVITAFISGLVIMGAELTAARIVAPIIGNSIYTWTSVIGVILLGLSFGNYAGGFLIDKKSDKKILSKTLLLSAVFIALIPILTKFVSSIVFWELSLLLRIIAVSFSLFFVPSFFLGTLYPIYLRLYLRQIDDAGKRAGLLSSASALGGITGTFLTGFVLIGFLGTTYSFYLMSLVLIINSLLIDNPLKSRFILFFFLSFGMIISLNYIVNGEKLNTIFETESGYYKIRIADNIFNNHPARLIFLDFDVHSIESLDGKKIGIYQEISPFFQIFKKDLKKILVVGGGSYNIPKDLYRLYGGNVTVAEIDPGVTKMAEDFFGLKSFPIKTDNSDGRLFLNTSQGKFDIIVQDAFNSFISMPWHLVTRETNEVAKKHLTPEGIYALSIISAREGKNSLIYKSIVKTFAETFPEYHALFLEPEQETIQNIILIGINSEIKMREDEEGIRKEIEKITLNIGFPKKITYEYKPKTSEDAIYLTDDFAPLEKLSLRPINDFFNSYAGWYYQN